MNEPTIYKNLGEREVHLFGGCVGVCWNLGRETKELRDTDGTIYYAKKYVRFGKPYIDFVMTREFSDGTIAEDEGSPVDGGFGAGWAEKTLLPALQEAIAYCKRLEL
jgi:hypothetical protein